MQELEKILEEIEQRKARAEKLIVKPPHDKLDQVANDTAEAFIEAYKECQDIIRKHMNDGWVPVEDRLPTKHECEKDNNEFLVQTNTGERFSCEYDPLSNGYDDPLWCCNVPVVAWQPLPEPYRPERSNNHDRE